MVRLIYATGTELTSWETDPEIRAKEFAENVRKQREEIARDEAAGINYSAHLPNYNGSDAPDD